jgi:hypothetical protein
MKDEEVTANVFFGVASQSIVGRLLYVIFNTVIINEGGML